jgi:hypothetical protein
MVQPPAGPSTTRLARIDEIRPAAKWFHLTGREFARFVRQREFQTNSPAEGLKLDVALAVALFGNFVLIVSVILLGLQVREMTKQSSHGVRATLASVCQAMNDDMLQINRLYVEIP